MMLLRKYDAAAGALFLARNSPVLDFCSSFSHFNMCHDERSLVLAKWYCEAICSCRLPSVYA